MLSIRSSSIRNVSNEKSLQSFANHSAKYFVIKVTENSNHMKVHFHRRQSDAQTKSTFFFENSIQLIFVNSNQNQKIHKKVV